MTGANNEIESKDGIISHSHGAIRSRADGASVIQVETLGRLGLFVILIMFVALVGLGIIAGYALGAGEARSESMSAEVRRLNAKVEVLQWEFDKASAQLIDKGLITPPE